MGSFLSAKGLMRLRTSESLRRLFYFRPVIIAAVSMFAGSAQAQVGSGGLIFWGTPTVRESANSRAPIGQVAAGPYVTAALRSDGTVVEWGDNSQGQCNVPPGLAGVTQIAVGLGYTVALKSDGSIVCWGSPTYIKQTLFSKTSAIQIAAGDNHVVALKADGTVLAFGRSNYFQASPPVNLKAKMIAAGANFCLALKADGTVVGWGDSRKGQTKIPAGLKDVVQIAASGSHSLALKADRTVVAWGDDSDGQSTIPKGLNNVDSVYAGANYSIALKSNGTAVGWGNDDDGQIGSLSGLKSIDRVAAGQNHAVFLLYNGDLRTFGNEDSGQCSIPFGFAEATQVAVSTTHSSILKADKTIATWSENATKSANTPPAGLIDVVQVANKAANSVALTSKGTVTVWGDDQFKQVTDSSKFSGITQVSLGKSHVVGLKGDGSVVAWGDNTDGQTTIPKGATDITEIAAGNDHNLALRKDGTVVAWGSDSDGQCRVPTGLSGVTRIAAGALHSLALKSDKTVVAWGSNSDGQTEVPLSLKNVVQIGAGDNYSLALQADGSVVCWGSNLAGQTLVPTSLKGISRLSAGESSAGAIPSVTVLIDSWHTPPGIPVNAKLSLPQNVAVDTEIAIESSTLLVSVPPLVKVLAGTRSASFVVTPNSSFVGTAIIKAKLNGAEAFTALTADPAKLDELSMNPTSVIGGKDVTGTVKLNGPAPSAGFNARFTSSQGNTDTISFPANVTIPAGKSSESFTITTKGVASKTLIYLYALEGNFLRLSAPITIMPANLSGLTVAPSTLKGGFKATGTVSLDGPAGAGGTVLDVVSNNASVSVPKQVTIPAGKSSVDFDITAIPVSADATVSISASLGTVKKSATLLLQPQYLASIKLAPGSVAGGNASDLTVTLDSVAPSTGVVVKLSSNSSFATVPATITIAAGKSSATLSVATKATDTSLAAIITATYGSVSKSAQLTIQPPALKSVSMSLPSVIGGQSCQGTVTLDGPAPAGGTFIQLKTSYLFTSLPALVTVPAGETTASFTVTSKPVKVSTLVLISAIQGAMKKEAKFTLEPPDLLSVSVSPSSLKGGPTITGTVVLNTAANAEKIVINLSSDKQIFALPSSVTVPVGQDRVTFKINTPTVTTTWTITITAKNPVTSTIKTTVVTLTK